ncbi:hypothetical protein GCM10022232_82290 [Streptomyces plumbiresistens]|uniref:Uncharacterized protein n=1 Tax=Streptomyces plumbiresistens TaxID=511811 RepID=A0ABP7TD91_9ACTN
MLLATGPAGEAFPGVPVIRRRAACWCRCRMGHALLRRINSKYHKGDEKYD